MRRLAVLVVLGVFACGPLSPPKADAGSGGGGGATGGGMGTGGGTGGGGSDGGTGGGVGTGGGLGGGGGGEDAGPSDAGSRDFSFSQVAVSSSSTAPILGVGGVSGALWALQQSGRLLRSSGGGLSEAFAFTGNGVGLVVQGMQVVVALARELRVCTAQCEREASYDSFDLSARGEFAEAVCASAMRSWAVTSNAQNDARVYRRDGTQWTSLGAVPLRYPAGCWEDATGALWIAGQGGVVRFDGTGSFIAVGGPQVLYWSGVSYGTETFVVGAAATIGRLVDGGVVDVSQHPPGATFALAAVGGPSDAPFALGVVQGSTQPRYLRWDGSSWLGVSTSLPALVGSGSVNVVHTTSPNEVYFAGANDVGAWMVRGTR